MRTRDFLRFGGACLMLIAGGILPGQPARAHDTWVQTNTNLTRSNDAIHIDLMLGNHGNAHRDFKVAGKLEFSDCRLNLIAPAGRVYNLQDRLVDQGYAPKEGFWTAKFVPVEPGLYVVAHSLDKIVNHGAPVRSVRSAKTFFVVSRSLDNVPLDSTGFDRPLGHALELVPVSHPVTPMGPGQKLHLQLLFNGKPLANTRISFIPRGETLAEDFDKRYEKLTDERGRASFTPLTGNYYLAVAHHVEPEKGETGYTSTKYSATLTLFVPEVCPCCGE